MVWSALATIGSSLIGGITARQNQRSAERAQQAANAQNLQIAEMNNDTIAANNAAQIKAHYDQLNQQQRNYRSNLRFARQQANRSQRWTQRNWTRTGRQNALARNLALNGVSLRVRDAQRAGLHPLFALGANTASMSPGSPAQFIPGQAPSGNVAGTGLAMASPVTPQVSPVHADSQLGAFLASGITSLVQQASSARADDAIAKYYESLAKRTEQEANAVRIHSVPNDFVRGRSSPTELVPLSASDFARRGTAAASAGVKRGRVGDPFSKPMNEGQRHEALPESYMYAPTKGRSPYSIRNFEEMGFPMEMLNLPQAAYQTLRRIWHWFKDNNKPSKRSKKFWKEVKKRNLRRR